MADTHKANIDDIKPGMIVEATEGDLGDADLSKPKVVEVARDSQNHVEGIKVKKGVLFAKEIDIPVERISGVAADSSADAPPKVMVEATIAETDALTSTGVEVLGANMRDPQPERDALDDVQEAMPTAEGLSDLETANAQSNPPPSKHLSITPAFVLKTLGPGLVAGMAGNDAAAVTTYALSGAQKGYGQLWLLLLSTPFYQAVQYAAAKVGRVSQKGLADILRENYSRPAGVVASLMLIGANIALIAGDLLAIGSGLELITALNWAWFVVPVALVMWYFTVYRNFDTLKKIFFVLSFAFISYVITAILSGAHWGEVLTQTFVPQLDFTFTGISTAVALLGATISPYSIYWQVQGEKEEQRPGTKRQQITLAFFDTLSGVVSGNLIAYFIIVCTAATLFANHKTITTAADAAQSLEPLLGPAAKYLFAFGLIGAGLVAVPILLASTSYAVSGTFNLPASLSKKPWQNEGFYLILTAALIASLVVAFIGGNPIQLMFWANVLNGVLAPVLVVYLLIVGNNRKIMGTHSLHWFNTLVLVLTALLMFAATGLLFFGLATGQSG